MRAKTFSMIGLEVDLDYPQQVNIWIDLARTDEKRAGEIDVFYCQEPPEISPRPTQYVRENLNNFDLIIVSTDDLIGLSDKVIPLEYGTALVEARECYPDQFSVSMVIGDKRQTDGHQLRHEIWQRQDEITAPKNFYIGQLGGHHNGWREAIPNIDNPWNWPTLHESKEPLFDSMFHIVIENTRSRFWFTEKLIDCLLSKSVPIYWGCENVEDYFDVRGLLLATSADEIIAQANSITPKMYEALLPFIEINQARAKKYLNLGQRLGNLIEQRLSCKS